MWPQLEPLVQRLVADPYDADALANAREGGAADPESYALLLERVGVGSSNMSHASHWLVEAANVWSTRLGDAHRAARALMAAIDRDPMQRLAVRRLAELYREKGEVTSLVALFQRRARVLAPLAHRDAEVRIELAATYEELGRLWSESFKEPKRAVESFRHAYQTYRGVLASVPAHPEALLWVEDYLRSQRDYAALRDVLLAAAREPGESVGARTERLRKLAELSERTLRDAEGAIHAYEQLLAIDPDDDGLRRALIGLLERSGRWDDLATLLEKEAEAKGDLEAKIALEKKLAKLHETGRRDLAAAA
jgi:tetratricopeptide (TPR) repeat protein